MAVHTFHLRFEGFHFHLRLPSDFVHRLQFLHSIAASRKRLNLLILSLLKPDILLGHPQFQVLPAVPLMHLVRQIHLKFFRQIRLSPDFHLQYSQSKSYFPALVFLILLFPFLFPFVLLSVPYLHFLLPDEPE